MTSVTPTITVLLDDGSGTYPVDITSRVNLSQSVSVSGHGRTDEFGQAVATTFTCTLNNNDGHLSNGTIPLSVAQGIRYKQHFGSTTVNRFTGRISEAALGLSATGKASAVIISAVDALSELARRPVPLSSVDQELLADVADGAYYSLQEASGRNHASDVSGNNHPNLNRVVSGAGTAAFGTDMGLPDGATGVILTAPSAGDTAVLEVTTGDPWVSPSIHINFAWNRLVGDVTSVALLELVTVHSVTGGFYTPFTITNSGTSTITAGALSAAVPGTSVFDANVIGINITSGASALWIDGVKVATAAGMSVTWGADPLVKLGDDSGGAASILRLSRLTYGPAISDARMAAEQNAMLTDFVGETTAARFTRIAGYAGFTASTPSNSGQTLAVEGPPDGTLLDVLQTVTAAEGGVMFVNGTGTLVMQGRNYRALNVIADLTIPGKDIDAGTTIPLDDQQLVNQVTVTTTDGTVQIYENSTAITNQGLYAQSLDLALPDAASALSAAQWLVNKHSTATPRVGTALVKILTSSQAEQIIQAEIGDRWALSSMPTQLWSGAGDLSLEGWSETLTVGTTNEWSMTANLLPFAIFQAGVWDDGGSLWDSAVWAY